MNERDLQAAYSEMEDILTGAIEDWKIKRQDYGDAFIELGAAGQFSEIWRKIKKLKRAVWDGEALHGETPSQIAIEIIPHCLMMAWCLRHGRKS